MVNTSAKRVNLLKAGVSERTINRLYVEQNGFRIVNNVLFEGCGI